MPDDRMKGLDRVKDNRMMIILSFIEMMHLNNLHVYQLEPRHPQGIKRNEAAFVRQEWQDRVTGP